MSFMIGICVFKCVGVSCSVLQHVVVSPNTLRGSTSKIEGAMGMSIVLGICMSKYVRTYTWYENSRYPFCTQIVAQDTSTAVFCPFVIHLCIYRSSFWHFHESFSSWQLDDSCLRHVRRQRFLACSRHTCVFVNRDCNVYMTHWVRDN